MTLSGQDNGQLTGLELPRVTGLAAREAVDRQDLGQLDPGVVLDLDDGGAVFAFAVHIGPGGTREAGVVELQVSGAVLAVAPSGLEVFPLAVRDGVVPASDRHHEGVTDDDLFGDLRVLLVDACGVLRP